MTPHRMANIQALLFDMDGVVIDSEPIHEEAQRIVFREHELAVPESEFPSFKGMTEQKVFQRIVADFGSERHDVDVLVAAKEETFQSLLVDLELVPGVLEFIRFARDRYRLALTTSSARPNQRFAFDKFDLHEYFDVVVTAEDIEHPKPHPQPYLITAQRMNVGPEACLVLEDSLHGVRSANRAGCHVVGLTTSFSAADLTKAGAHVTIDGFDQLPEVLSASFA